MTQRPRDRVPRPKTARQSKSTNKLLMIPFFDCYDPETKTQSSQTQNCKTEQIHQQTFDEPFFYRTVTVYMHCVPTGQTVNKEYFVEVLREFGKRFRWKRPALFKSGQWHFQQDNAPVHNSILVTDYLTKMGIKTVPHPPYSRDLAPCDFWLFPWLVMRQLRR